MTLLVLGAAEGQWADASGWRPHLHLGPDCSPGDLKFSVSDLAALVPDRFVGSFSLSFIPIVVAWIDGVVGLLESVTFPNPSTLCHLLWAAAWVPECRGAAIFRSEPAFAA